MFTKLDLQFSVQIQKESKHNKRMSQSNYLHFTQFKKKNRTENQNSDCNPSIIKQTSWIN